MAFIPTHGLQESLLASIAKRLRELTMNDWLKLGITVLGFGIITWSAVQQHEYRLDKLEQSFEEHLDKHDEQNVAMMRSLTQIQIDVSRLNAKAEEAIRSR